MAQLHLIGLESSILATKGGFIVRNEPSKLAHEFPRRPSCRANPFVMPNQHSLHKKDMI